MAKASAALLGPLQWALWEPKPGKLFLCLQCTPSCFKNKQRDWLSQGSWPLRDIHPKVGELTIKRPKRQICEYSKLGLTWTLNLVSAFPIYLFYSILIIGQSNTYYSSMTQNYFPVSYSKRKSFLFQLSRILTTCPPLKEHTQRNSGRVCRPDPKSLAMQEGSERERLGPLTQYRYLNYRVSEMQVKRNLVKIAANYK